MKWGRKKQQPSSSSSSSKSSPFSSTVPFLSHVLPSSWLSKFKRVVDTRPKPAKGNIVSSSKGDVGEGKFYERERDASWRLSLGEEKIGGKMNADMLRSVRNEPGDELGCRRCGSDAVKQMVAERKKRYENGIVWEVQEMEEYRRDTDILLGEKATMIKTPRVIQRKRYEEAVKGIRLRVQRNKRDAEQKSTNSEENFTAKVEAVKHNPAIGRGMLTGNRLGQHKSQSSVNLKTFSLTMNNSVIAAQNMEESHQLSPENLSSEWQRRKEMKIEEVKMKSEKQRKSLYMSRELPRRRPKQAKVGVFSPRTPSKVETCKIKALEDKKKAKLKMKATKQRRKESISLENFAVEKCSIDPEKDFRDSMTEMIMGEKITRPEELEELLACYLTLNSDEFHDLIIRAFRQVWLDLDQASSEPFHTELHSEDYFQS